MTQHPDLPSWPGGGALGAHFEAAPGFIAVFHGPEHRWVFANRAFERLFPNRAISGETARSAFPETAVQGFPALMDRVFTTGERYVGEQVPMALDSSEQDTPRQLFLDFVYEPIRDEDGTVTGIFLEGYDVTKRVLAEAALREREARYNTLFDSIDEGFCIIEMIFDDGQPVDYRFLETNASFERQTGLVGAQGRTARELIPGLERHWFEIYGRVALTGEPLRFTDGSAAMGRWFDVDATRIGEAGSHTVGILFTDITARRQAEAERERLLASEREARTAAEAAVQARDTFLSIAAHELKTPLTALKAVAQLLLRRQERGQLEPDRLVNGLNDLTRAVNRLSALTDDLLDVASLRTGQLPLSPRATDLATLAREAVQRVNERDDGRHRLTLEALGDLPPVLADAVRIEQVLTNLLDNATKYSPQGGPVEVTILTAGAGVTLSVRDAGMGLPEGATESIFEPFGRARNAAASNLPGMGLGLYICRNIVERHGGWIRAASAGEGHGMTVTLWLPFADPLPGE